MTAPKPAADGNTGSHTAVGAPATPAMAYCTARWIPWRRCHANDSSIGVPVPREPPVAAM
jgi:hypothetical protein